jgi:hypothetical protein
VIVRQNIDQVRVQVSGEIFEFTLRQLAGTMHLRGMLASEVQFFDLLSDFGIAFIERAIAEQVCGKHGFSLGALQQAPCSGGAIFRKRFVREPHRSAE